MHTMNTKNTEAIEAALLSSIEVEIANANMQHPIPIPLNMKRARRPNLSIVKKATKHDKNFQVRVPPARILEV